MRAREDVEIVRDMTPAILLISFSLHDAFLHSHCSACFSPLSPVGRSHHAATVISPRPSFTVLLFAPPPTPLSTSPRRNPISSPPSPSPESSADLCVVLRLTNSVS
ncbi:unnamed protein product [Linum trigynum]|uniref:Uncharacterized protein n=1 Tax=Linum trigynum TaxID=586398 RepID=A0AAV2FBU1_9ROSI